MALNIAGMTIAASFELIVTLIAIFELCVFMGAVAPGFSTVDFLKGGWSGADTFSMASWPGGVAAIPFAILFFLAIEGVAMAAEEAKNPDRSVPVVYIGGILTLVALALGVIKPRRNEPRLARPFAAPVYPLFPASRWSRR